jgi:hypothetical protein
LSFKDVLTFISGAEVVTSLVSIVVVEVEVSIKENTEAAIKVMCTSLIIYLNLLLMKMDCSLPTFRNDDAPSSLFVFDEENFVMSFPFPFLNENSV